MARQKKKITPNSLMIVTQSNKLVEARYNLPLGEQRLILTMIARIQPDDEDFKPYCISVAELADFLGVNKGSAYRECKKITESLLQRVLSIQEPDGLLQIGWVSSAKYIDGTGMVNLSFDPLLKPYLLQLKSDFTKCRLGMLLSFKSQYTMRMYSLLKQYRKLQVREVEVDVLRNILGLRKNQYTLYSNFKKDIIEATRKELAEKADLYFEFDEIKYGRKVTGIRFRIFTNIMKVSEIEPSDNPDNLLNKHPPLGEELFFLISLVPVQHRSKKTILSAIEQYENKRGFDYVKRNILYSNAKAERSYAGFLVKALKDDWGHDWELDQQEAATNKKKPLEVWERQGFTSQKEYDEFMYNKQLQNYGKPQQLKLDLD